MSKASSAALIALLVISLGVNGYFALKLRVLAENEERRLAPVLAAPVARGDSSGQRGKEEGKQAGIPDVWPIGVLPKSGLAALVAQLRSSGMPDDIVRAVVGAMINREYGQKLAEAAFPRDMPY